MPSLKFTEAARSRDATTAMWVHFAIEREGQVWGDRKPVPIEFAPTEAALESSSDEWVETLSVFPSRRGFVLRDPALLARFRPMVCRNVLEAVVCSSAWRGCID